jgi:hypothetical protein
VTEKTKLGKIRVAAGLGKPAAGDADMGDVASQLTNQCSKFIEDSGNLSPFSGQRAKCGYFLSVSTFDLVGYRHGL